MSEFFSGYKDKRVPRIPYIEMNAPIVPLRTKGSIGLELEIEGHNLPNSGHLERIRGETTGCRWATHADGSLRGENFEYVFNVPCVLDELPILVNGLWDKFASYESALNLSNRCSTHVHINMGGKKINELTSVMALWMVFEEALINWCGEERKANHFCLSSKDSKDLPQAWSRYLRTGDSSVIRDGMKYSALNLRRLWDLGSFEFRTGPAPSDPEMIINWATFLHHFVEFACKTYVNPQQMGFDLSERTGGDVFKEICDKGGLETFYTQVVEANAPYDFNKSCIEGFRNAQPFVMGFPWDDWLQIIDREYIPNPFDKKKKPSIRFEDRVNEIEDRPNPAPEFRTIRPAEVPRWEFPAGGRNAVEVEVQREMDRRIMEIQRRHLEERRVQRADGQNQDLNNI